METPAIRAACSSVTAPPGRSSARRPSRSLTSSTKVERSRSSAWPTSPPAAESSSSSDDSGRKPVTSRITLERS
ncbi:MAG: hypothetical protein FJ253_03600 [Phycisphaerae bacterium]|nr:hypothetical protein [Phycisphaerae bacterium]